MYWFLIRTVSLLFRVFSSLVLLYCILSWFVRPGSGMLFRIYCRLEDLLEPMIYPFRRLTAGVAYRTGVDFAPWLTLIAFNIAENLIYMILTGIFR